MTSSTPPWYRQFWPIFLIILPLCAVVASFVTLYIAASGNTDMVVDDYYKEGKAINLRLEKYQRAKELGINVELQLVAENTIEMVFAAGEPDKTQPMSISFFHPTMSDKDFNVQLIVDANGLYSGGVPNGLTGKWHLQVQPFNQEWKIRDTVSFPREGLITLTP